MQMDGNEVLRRKEELRRAVSDLRDRGLYTAAKFAAELLSALPEVEEKASKRKSRTPERGRSAADEDEDALQSAKCYFELKEYKRAAHALRRLQGPRAVFLRSYATYLLGEARKEEERLEAGGLLGSSQAVNKELQGLDLELQEVTGEKQADPFLLYLHGLVQIDRDNRAEGKALLLRSLQAFPWNWSAWLALGTLQGSADLDADSALPRHWMRNFFLTHVCVEGQENEEALGRLSDLTAEFPDSDWISGTAAMAQYNLRNFDEAQELYEDLLERDPHRIDGMDTYSNILYVKEQFAALSHLAHRVAAADKYRPETCCIIGNYYSLKGQHEKAVIYFRRALKLSRHYLSAWTLMGHEYVEMKNPPAAIEAYRKAVDLNPRDYRAWYGLGQTYELLHMPVYALHYYQRATQLRPHDARFWCAMGQCYAHEQLAMDEAAIRCYQRAHDSDDREGIALHRLAQAHERRGDAEQAAYYYEMNLHRMDAEQVAGSEAVDALMFLAAYHKERGTLALAEGLCMRLLDYGASSKERARALLREIRSLQVDSSEGSWVTRGEVLKVKGGLGVLGQVAGRMDVLDFGAGGMTPSPMNPEAEYMDPAGSDIELSPG